MIHKKYIKKDTSLYSELLFQPVCRCDCGDTFGYTGKVSVKLLTQIPIELIYMSEDHNQASSVVFNATPTEQYRLRMYHSSVDAIKLNVKIEEDSGVSMAEYNKMVKGVLYSSDNTYTHLAHLVDECFLNDTADIECPACGSGGCYEPGLELELQGAMVRPLGFESREGFVNDTSMGLNIGEGCSVLIEYVGELDEGQTFTEPGMADRLQQGFLRCMQR